MTRELNYQILFLYSIYIDRTSSLYMFLDHIS